MAKKRRKKRRKNNHHPLHLHLCTRDTPLLVAQGASAGAASRRHVNDLPLLPPPLLLPPHLPPCPRIVIIIAVSRTMHPTHMVRTMPRQRDVASHGQTALDHRYLLPIAAMAAYYRAPTNAAAAAEVAAQIISAILLLLPNPSAVGAGWQARALIT